MIRNYALWCMSQDFDCKIIESIGPIREDFKLLFLGFLGKNIFVQQLIGWFCFRFIVLSAKCQKMVKHAHHNLSEPMVRASNSLSCPIIQLKHQNFPIYNPILTSEKLESVNDQRCSLIPDLNYYQNVCWLIHFPLSIKAEVGNFYKNNF